MAEIVTSEVCYECRKRRKFTKQKFSTFWGIFLSIITYGGFLLFWLPLMYFESKTPFRCSSCGSELEEVEWEQ